MRVLSPILNQIVYPVLGRTGYLRSKASAAVVTYHGVVPDGYRSSDSFLDNALITVEHFRSQLALLKRNYNVISPGQFRQWLRGSDELPERAVLLTCDDGLLNNLTVMVPVLQELGMECLFFVTGASPSSSPTLLWYIELYLMMMEGRSGNRATDQQRASVPALENSLEKRRGQWLTLVSALSALDANQRADFMREAGRMWGLDTKLTRRCLDDPLSRERFQLLSAAQLRELLDAGMTIGAHTMTHPELSRQSDELARTEITNCRQDLEQCTGREIWALAFPFGNPATVGEREFRLAEEAGYECAFMNISGPISRASMFGLPRVHVTVEMTLDAFEAHVSGFHQSLRRLLR